MSNLKDGGWTLRIQTSTQTQSFLFLYSLNLQSVIVIFSHFRVIPSALGSAEGSAVLRTTTAGMGGVPLLLVPWVDVMMPPWINELLTAALLKCKVYVVVVVPELQPANFDRLSLGRLLLPNWGNRLWAKPAAIPALQLEDRGEGCPLM